MLIVNGLYIRSLLTYSKELKTNLENVNFDEKEVQDIKRKLQTISISGTVKIMNTFMGIQSVKSSLELIDVFYPQVLCSSTFYFLILKYLFVLSLFFCLEPDDFYCTYNCSHGIYSIKLDYYLPCLSASDTVKIAKAFMGSSV